MGYNHISAAWKDFTFSLLHFDYGAQNHTDDTGIILGSFRPSTIVAYVGWGNELKYKSNKIENVAVGFGGKIINHILHTDKAKWIFVLGRWWIHVKQLWIHRFRFRCYDKVTWGFAPKLNNYII